MLPGYPDTPPNRVGRSRSIRASPLDFSFFLVCGSCVLCYEHCPLLPVRIPTGCNPSSSPTGTATTGSSGINTEWRFFVWHSSGVELVLETLRNVAYVLACACVSQTRLLGQTVQSCPPEKNASRLVIS
eukprot:3937239-Rhodomonas_salina.2